MDGKNTTIYKSQRSAESRPTKYNLSITYLSRRKRDSNNGLLNFHSPVVTKFPIIYPLLPKKRFLMY
jgi:hypothetical protein